MIPIFGFDPGQLATSMQSRKLGSVANVNFLDSDFVPPGRVWIILAWFAYQTGSSTNRRMRLMIVMPTLENIAVAQELNVGDFGSATLAVMLQRPLVVPGLEGKSHRLRASRDAFDVGSGIEMQFWYLDLALPSLRTLSGAKQGVPPRVDEVWPLPSLFTL